VIRVKICGLTRAEDAALAVALGADALGFVFWPRSPRAVTPQAVRAIVDGLPAFVTRVGVFVNAAPEQVADIVGRARLDVAQLHGDERVEDFVRVPVRLIRGVSLGSDDDVRRVADWPAEITPLVDAADPERRGGTGQKADWIRAAALAAMRPIVLAGGLRAENVEGAMRVVRPWAVDVSSGVEDAPGIKGAERLRALFGAVMRARTEGL
jgi:phosphoribosylanthranilate isomerase